MSIAPIAPVVVRVAYEAAARRHMADAEALYATERYANAGQLYGFVAECGVKALLIACGIKPDADGGIPWKFPAHGKEKNLLRKHVPMLLDNIDAALQLIPDGSQATKYLAQAPSLSKFQDWQIEHRYWHEAVLPISSVTQWRTAACELSSMLDQAKQDGVL